MLPPPAMELKRSTLGKSEILNRMSDGLISLDKLMRNEFAIVQGRLTNLSRCWKYEYECMMQRITELDESEV